MLLPEYLPSDFKPERRHGLLTISFAVLPNPWPLQWLMHRPAGTEASVQVSSGAVNLSFDGRQFRGVGDKAWQSSGYEHATDAYQVEVNGGSSTVTMDTSNAQ